MADNSRFGSGKTPHFGGQFGDRISPGSFADGGNCAQCENMLADALDGTLSAADQALFDAHLALCEPCSTMLADARRGAAWLEMLRHPRPEPPAALLERILAQTSGTPISVAHALGAQGSGTQIANLSPAGHPAALQPAYLPAAAPILSFPGRFAAGFRRNLLGNALLQPRLAMTAAMAFFSIALTMNLTGVRLSELRPGDLKPASIKRGFYAADARAVQYYDSLRVVYEFESRVHDLETESGSGSAPPASQTAPAPDSTPQPTEPRPTKPAPKAPGSSRREGLLPSARLVATLSWFSSRPAPQSTYSEFDFQPAANHREPVNDATKVRALA